MTIPSRALFLLSHIRAHAELCTSSPKYNKEEQGDHLIHQMSDEDILQILEDEDSTTDDEAVVDILTSTLADELAMEEWVNKQRA
jgi:hypothetical protein